MEHIRRYLSQGHTIDDVERLLAANDLSCIGGFDCVVECFSAPEPRAQNQARILANARFLSALGGTNMVVGTDGPADLARVADPIGEMAAAFAAVADIIQGTGVTLCIEANWSPVVKSLRTAAAIARRAGRSNIGLIFDPAHYHCTPTKFDQLSAENIALIRHVHVDDMRDKPGELSNCNSDRALPGQGCLDLKGLFGHIEKHGYEGYFSIEMFNDELWAMPPQQAAQIMYDSLLWLCE